MKREKISSQRDALVSLDEKCGSSGVTLEFLQKKLPEGQLLG